MSRVFPQFVSWEQSETDPDVLIRDKLNTRGWLANMTADVVRLWESGTQVQGDQAKLDDFYDNYVNENGTQFSTYVLELFRLAAQAAGDSRNWLTLDGGWQVSWKIEKAAIAKLDIDTGFSNSSVFFSGGSDPSIHGSNSTDGPRFMQLRSDTGGLNQDFQRRGDNGNLWVRTGGDALTASMHGYVLPDMVELSFGMTSREDSHAGLRYMMINRTHLVVGDMSDDATGLFETLLLGGAYQGGKAINHRVTDFIVVARAPMFPSIPLLRYLVFAGDSLMGTTSVTFPYFQCAAYQACLDHLMRAGMRVYDHYIESSSDYELPITSITSPGSTTQITMNTTLQGGDHGLQDGDKVIFENLAGNTPDLNDVTYTVTRIDADTIEIPVDSSVVGSGGIAHVGIGRVSVVGGASVTEDLTNTHTNLREYYGELMARTQASVFIMGDSTNDMNEEASHYDVGGGFEQARKAIIDDVVAACNAPDNLVIVITTAPSMRAAYPTEADYVAARPNESANIPRANAISRSLAGYKGHGTGARVCVADRNSAWGGENGRDIELLTAGQTYDATGGVVGVNSTNIHQGFEGDLRNGQVIGRTVERAVIDKSFEGVMT